MRYNSFHTYHELSFTINSAILLDIANDHNFQMINSQAKYE